MTVLRQSERRSIMILPFGAQEFGVSTEQMQQHLLPTYEDLPWDPYDVRRSRHQILRNEFPEDRKLQKIFGPYYRGELGDESLDAWKTTLSEEQRRCYDEIRPFRRRAASSFIIDSDDAHGWGVRLLPR